MIHLERIVTINRDPGEVFATISDVERDPEWMDGVLDSERLDAGPLRPGSRYRHTYRPVPGRPPAEYSFEVTDFQPASVFGYKSRAVNTDLVACYRLQPDGSGTRFTITADLEPHGIMRLVAPLVIRLMGTGIWSEFNELKRVLEHEGQE